MNEPATISLRPFTINELLRAPGISSRKRTLSNDAEEFIIEEAEGLPRSTPITINVHLGSADQKFQEEIGAAIHKHFYHRRIQSKKTLNSNFQHGWRMLLFALLLLAFIFTLTEIAVTLFAENKVVTFVGESFIILGWVALWRPMELLLYDWYPVKREMALFRRLETSDVTVVIE